MESVPKKQQNSTIWTHANNNRRDNHCSVKNGVTIGPKASGSRTKCHVTVMLIMESVTKKLNLNTQRSEWWIGLPWRFSALLSSDLQTLTSCEAKKAEAPKGSESLSVFKEISIVVCLLNMMWYYIVILTATVIQLVEPLVCVATERATIVRVFVSHSEFLAKHTIISA